ncbi:MAG: hypothetical protein AB7I25_02635 [Vicinamibacterales bacterium]
MRTISELLQAADPLRHEPAIPEELQARARRAVMAAAGESVFAEAPGRRRLAWGAAAALLLLATALTAGLWPTGGAVLLAAIRFEVRLAEEGPGPGLLEMPVAGAGRSVHVHKAPIVTNDDIAQSRVVTAGDGTEFGVSIQFTQGGAEKLRQATAAHIGRPVALLIDGQVVMAPVLRSPLGNAASISGRYTRAEADRIVAGMAKDGN